MNEPDGLLECGLHLAGIGEAMVRVQFHRPQDDGCQLRENGEPRGGMRGTWWAHRSIAEGGSCPVRA